MNTTKDLHQVEVDGSNHNMLDARTKVRPSTEGGRPRQRKSTIDPSCPNMMINKESELLNSLDQKPDGE